MKDVQIGGYEEGLVILDDFDGNEQRDWHQVRVQNPVGEDVGKELLCSVDSLVLQIPQVVANGVSHDNVAY